jgi:hypothetical protein
VGAWIGHRWLVEAYVCSPCQLPLGAGGLCELFLGGFQLVLEVFELFLGQFLGGFKLELLENFFGQFENTICLLKLN